MWFQKHQKPEVLMHPNMIYELSRLSLSRDGTRIYEITFNLDFYHSQLLQLVFFAQLGVTNLIWHLAPGCMWDQRRMPLPFTLAA